jgi:hypothetical protein
MDCAPAPLGMPLHSRCASARVARRASRSADEVLVVHVAGMDAGRATADAAHRRIRREAHDAEERLVQRDNDALCHLAGLRLAVDRNNAGPKRGEFVGQCAGIGPLAVEAVVDGEIDLKNAHFEHVARLRAPHLDRTSLRAREAEWELGTLATDNIVRHSRGAEITTLHEVLWMRPRVPPTPPM